MMTAELHPEEMLDAARAGTLNSRAAVDLNAHLARCSACRLHLRLTDDFAVDGRALRNDSVLVSGLVRAALAEPATGAGSWSSRSQSRTSRLLQRLMLPAACVLLGGGAATAMWSVRSDLRWAPEIELLPTTHQTAPKVKARAARGAVNRPAPPPAPLLEPAPSETIAPAPPVLSAPPASRLPARAARPARHIAARAAAPAVEAALPQAATATPRSTAGTLFAEANRARRDGAYGRASALYRQLRGEFAGSREEITARVIVGQLALAESHWSRALGEFESYLVANPNGTLAEEAQVGRATALMRLSRADAEREAWSQLLKRHPSSMHADRARARLEALRP